MSTPVLGNLIRISPLRLSELPPHPTFADTNEETGASATNPEQPASPSRPALERFVKEVLDQAVSFVDDALPKTFKAGSQKRAPPSTAKVQVLKRDISVAELGVLPWSTSAVTRKAPATSGETWFARRSVHSNKSEAGTADFEEFAKGLRDDHSEHEREYTPDVYDSYKVLDWDSQTAKEDFTIEGYSMVRARIYEMAHAIPAPLSPRVFSVLVVTANTGSEGFVVAQVPVDLSALPAALYSNARNVREGDTSQKKKRVVLGVYTSVERVKMVNDSMVEWVMATASDAKGWLPMPMQKMGVPGAVVKDVGYLMKWVAEKRGK